MMASQREMEIEIDEHEAAEGEPDLERMVQYIQNLFKFKSS